MQWSLLPTTLKKRYYKDCDMHSFASLGEQIKAAIWLQISLHDGIIICCSFPLQDEQQDFGNCYWDHQKFQAYYLSSVYNWYTILMEPARSILVLLLLYFVAVYIEGICFSELTDYMSILAIHHFWHSTGIIMWWQELKLYHNETTKLHPCKQVVHVLWYIISQLELWLSISCIV